MTREEVMELTPDQYDRYIAELVERAGGPKGYVMDVDSYTRNGIPAEYGADK
jgi:hypothetical protein